MNGWQKKVFFDKQDYELLSMVNRLLHITDDDNRLDRKLLDANLHPHGIKALAAPREMRIAGAVIRLLDSLELGKADDRLSALQALYDEVLTTAQSALRLNTARVLIQTMKELVRSNGNEDRQLMLAHDFRQAVTGAPRVVRRLLHDYHLLEMPEDWSQLAFDHHVHDANTKGRKTPTHLIMDAWLKGIRYLTIIYYNHVEAAAASELMQAAAIMGVSVRIGLEFACPFRGRYVHFIWVPQGLADDKSFLEFLSEPPVCHLMQQGREASAWQQKHVYKLLERWNAKHRLDAGQRFGIELFTLSEDRFKSFVGSGQASLLHLAEYIYKSYLSLFTQRSAQLEQHKEQSKGEERTKLEEELRTIAHFGPSLLLYTWLAPKQNPELPDPEVPSFDQDVPAILQQSPLVLLDWLSSLRPGHRIILNLASLSPEDVLELLWTCQGLITHLEIFNLKEWLEGKLARIEDINKLQLAINTGSAPRLKQLIRNMIEGFIRENPKAQDTERYALFMSILRDIPSLQSFYKHSPLRTRIGTDSTSRVRKTLGMGLVFDETLPPHVRRKIRRQKNTGVHIPIHIDVFEQVQYRRNTLTRYGTVLPRLIRRLPGCKRFGYSRLQAWYSQSATATVGAPSNVMPLGGSIADNSTGATPVHKQDTGIPPRRYLNTKLTNGLKVLLGLIPAILSFQYTQTWWVLIWFGPFIWFGITGVRNIVQSVVGGGGIFQTTLLRWNDYVSWTRLCDSLMYTGFSVPLLELGLRSFLLEHSLGLTVENSPVLVYATISAVNGLYICSHNLYRGLPKEAAIGNLFRSALAIPIAVLYSWIIYNILAFAHVANPYLIVQPAAAVITKMASDTVAALIEGFGDRQTNMRMRRWDYKSKLGRVFDTYAQLELLFPEKDVLAMLDAPDSFLSALTREKSGKEVELIINSLDLMHFWLYLPRAQSMLTQLVRQMSADERLVFLRSQFVLRYQQEVSRRFVDGLAGRNFARPLAFYLDRHNEYLHAMDHLCTGNNFKG